MTLYTADTAVADAASLGWPGVVALGLLLALIGFCVWCVTR